MSPAKGVIVQIWVGNPIDKRHTNMFDKIFDYSLHFYPLVTARGVIKDAQDTEIEAPSILPNERTDEDRDPTLERTIRTRPRPLPPKSR